MDYRSLPRISNSDLTEFRDFLFGDSKPKPTKAFAFGSALHELILEPNTICELPDGVDLGLVQQLARLARVDRYLAWVLQFSRKETVRLWDDPLTGLPLKSKLDLIHKGRLIVDIKSTSCRTFDEWLRSAEKYEYDRQAAFYLDAVDGQKFSFVIVQKQKPFNIWNVEYHTNSEFIEGGRKKYRKLLREWLRHDVMGTPFTPSSWAKPELIG